MKLHVAIPIPRTRREVVVGYKKQTGLYWTVDR